MSPEPDAAAGEVILVALSALVMPGPEAPIAVPGAAEALDRLATLGRPVILARDHVAGRRLPEEPAARERWVRALLGRAIECDVVPFHVPAWDLHDAAGEAQAREAWQVARAEQRGTWLITDDPDDVRPARAAGLHVLLAGPRPADEPLAARADIAARDLADAARLLLAQELFGQFPAA